MVTQAILFDLYGTLIDIETDEGMEEIYRGIAHFLTYQGVHVHRAEVRDLYYGIMHRQRGASGEEYPEIDVEAIWEAFLREQGWKHIPGRIRMSTILAHLFRGLSRKRLQLYPGVKETLDLLRRSHRLGLVSDAQPCFALPEMRAMGLENHFECAVISGHHGFRKPDARLFRRALDTLGLAVEEVIFVGNDLYRDIFGAGRLGIRTIFFESNQGDHSYAEAKPDYVVSRFAQVVEGIEFLSSGGCPR
jgi:putative hydrolase of the HAD superfamily